MKIGFASADWATKARDDQGRPTWGGSGWYRCGLVAKHLRLIGRDVVEGTLVWDKTAGVFGVREWPADGEEAVIHHDLDIIVLQRWMFASVAVETSTAQANGQVVVQDVDDHFWALDPANHAYKATDPTANPIENRDHYLAALKAASVVTTSTEYLASSLRSLGVKCPVIVLPNAVEWDAFAEVRALNLRNHASLRVGWVGATTHRSRDLEELRGVLLPFLGRHRLQAYHGGHQEGAPTFARAIGLDDEMVYTRPMAPIDRYPWLMAGLDIGLVPLRDVVFNRAKSAIKGLEYAAAGVPFVASSSPAYEDLGIGRIARRRREWVRHLEDLLDPEVHRAEAEEQAMTVGVEHDIESRIVDWLDLYVDLYAGA